MKARIMLMLLVAAMVSVSGCSRYGCYWGACKDLGDRQIEYSAIAQDTSATPDEQTAALKEAALYALELYDNTMPFNGAYANPEYRLLLIRLAVATEAVAERAEAGALTDEQKQRALSSIARDFGKAQNGTLGKR